jgi:uncharacterized protein YraI
MRTRKRIVFLIILLLIFSGLVWFAPSSVPVKAQQPTGNIPTVTGTASGPFVTVNNPDGANVRAGPSSYDYAALGWLPPGATAPAIGRSPAQEWIEIVYLGTPSGVGWVYAPLVALSPGNLPIIEPPPTATPATTPTINPTFAAAFPIQTTPTRLPTFTQPPPLATLHFGNATRAGSSIPMGFVILGLAVIGILGAIISFLRGR